MTAYAASSAAIFAYGSTTTFTVAVYPVTYEIRVSQIVLQGFDQPASGVPGGNFQVYIAVTGPSALVGGTAITPFALRGGSPPATATVKTAGTPTGPGLASAFNTYLSASGLNYTFQTPFDLIVQPGSVVWAYTYVSAGSGDEIGFSCSVYFEELRLSWPY
jgi:hypothetical protein